MRKKYVEKRHKEQEIEQTLVNLETDYINQKKEELPQYLDSKLQEVSEELAMCSEDENITPFQIYEWIKSPTYPYTPKYTAEEMALIFDYYTKVVAEINKKTKYPPTKPNFCLFCGMSTVTYDKYLNGIDPRKKEVMQRIDQYIRDMQLTLGETGGLNPIVAMYRSKSEHGMYEAQAPKVIAVENDVDLDKIKEQLKAVENGESLTLKQGPDGVFRQDK